MILFTQTLNLKNIHLDMRGEGHLNPNFEPDINWANDKLILLTTRYHARWDFVKRES